MCCGRPKVGLYKTYRRYRLDSEHLLYDEKIVGHKNHTVKRWLQNLYQFIKVIGCTVFRFAAGFYLQFQAKWLTSGGTYCSSFQMQYRSSSITVIWWVSYVRVRVDGVVFRTRLHYEYMSREPFSSGPSYAFKHVKTLELVINFCGNCTRQRHRLMLLKSFWYDVSPIIQVESMCKFVSQFSII